MILRSPCSRTQFRYAEGDTLSEFDLPAEHPASILYTRVFTVLLTRWQMMSTFLRVAELGATSAEQQLGFENLLFAKRLVDGPDFDRFFKDKTGFLAFFGGEAGLAQKLTAEQVSSARSASAAAALVFAHSALDLCVSDLCRVAALCRPTDWDDWIGSRKVAFAEARASPLGDIRQSLVEKALDEIVRQSLLTRTDRMFALCKPAIGTTILRDFSFDRNRLERLDTLRHEVVHGIGNESRVTDIDGEIEFLHKTGLFLASMVHLSYGVQVDPAQMFLQRSTRSIIEEIRDLSRDASA